jgi:hypothetical protein
MTSNTRDAILSQLFTEGLMTLDPLPPHRLLMTR